MKKILLVCSAGMSTSLLVTRMYQAAKEEIKIDAFAISEAIRVAKEYDVILLGPQVRFQLNTLKKQIPDKIIAAIDMQAYGRMDGEKVLKMAYDLINEKQDLK